MNTSQFSLPRYFSRIHFTGQADANIATVTELMRCQLMRIPFENLDVQAGKIISIKPDDIVEKLLYRQRGGYCYEVNGLFALALEALQIPYFLIAARPFSHSGKKPKTHMALIVQLQGEKWLCDLGFGGHGIRAPMRLSLLDTEVNHDGELFMLSQENEHELVVKAQASHGWEQQYAFDLTPQKWIDFGPANYYNCTHPDSLFVRKLLVVLCTPVGRKILFGNTFKQVGNEPQTRQLLTTENRAALLLEQFGLVE